MHDESPLKYTVLAHEDECGLWLKIPEFQLQLLADDIDAGLGILEEHFDLVLEGLGRDPARPRIRTVRRVEKAEYGPTEVELEGEYRRREYAGDPGD